jgi:hypothetical protein
LQKSYLIKLENKIGSVSAQIAASAQNTNFFGPTAAPESGSITLSSSHLLQLPRFNCTAVGIFLFFLMPKNAYTFTVTDACTVSGRRHALLAYSSGLFQLHFTVAA